MKLWKYENNSRPDSRDIKWTINIGILKIKYTGGWHCRLIDLRILWLLHFHWNMGCSCGRYFKFHINKWLFSLSISNKWQFSISFGISELDWLFYKASKIKWTPEQIKEIKEILNIE